MESFNRFKRDIFVAILCFAALLGGCAYFTPSAKQTRAEVKVEKTKEAIFTSEEEILNEGKGYIFATKYALDLNPETNKFTTVAKQMSTKALVAIGQPDLVDVLKMQAIVDGLLSTNKAIVEEANYKLQEKDEKIINLQSKIHNYETVLKKNEAKFIEVSRENASLASTWVSIKRIFWWIIYGIIGLTIFRIVSAILPPPYNSIGFFIDYFAGAFGRVVFSILPKAKETAKVVGEEYKTTLKQVISSVQEAKEEVAIKNSSSPIPSVGLENLKNKLNNNMDINSKILVSDVKKELGYI